MRAFQKTLATCVAIGLSLASASLASAAFHLWKIDEVYSNASGSVQFIELSASNNGSQQFVQNETLKSNANSFTLPANLPSDTTNKFFILATPGYFALGGSVPTADYNLGVNNFFSVTGDTLNYAGGINTLTFTAGQLPTDGVNALERVYNPPTPTTFTTATNSPTNFAGVTGSIPEPTSFVLAALGFLGVSAFSRRFSQVPLAT
jgi:serralysin